MGVSSLEEKGIVTAPVLLLIFVFLIPISDSLKLFFLWGSIGVLLLTPYYRNLMKYTWNTLWGRSALALFLFVVLASLWSPAPYTLQAEVIGKYCKLVYLPILAVGFINPKIRNGSLNAYLFAIFITCVLSIMKARGLVAIGGTADQGEIFYNHIVTGFMVSFASYLAGLFVVQSKGWLRVVYVLLFILTSYQVIFVNTGRTGYIIYFILMVMLLLLSMPLKRAALGVVLFSCLFGLSYKLSPNMNLHVNALANDVRLLRQNITDTSLGYRLDFHTYAKLLLKERPITGIGTGGFEYRFAEDNPIPSWGRVLSNPHSQYWMILAEQGLTGFILFAVFMMSLFITSLKLKETRPVLLGFLIIFCIGCISDTIFCFSAAGSLLIIFSALCFGELMEQEALKIEHKTLKDPTVGDFCSQS